MASSKAATVSAYLKSLPADRRKVVSAVRHVVIENLPKGYQESINWGHISYEIPLERYPESYNGQPLSYAGLAAQKNYYVLYLFGVYANPKVGKTLASEFTKRGKKLDMGRSCLRFKTLDDLPLDVIANVIASTPVDEMISYYDKSRRRKK